MLDRPGNRRPCSGLLPFALVVAMTVTAGCRKAAEPPIAPSPPRTEPAAPADTPRTSSAMKAGMEALYTARDPDRAAELFRGVLKEMPGHYGATYQLGAALAAGGRFEEAKPVWQSVVTLAGRYHDASSLAEAVKQLRLPGLAFPEGLMARGVDALYKDHDAARAVALFKSVLGQMPTHYGATYQLAVALDRSGQADESRAVWEKVLASSTVIHDEPTVRAATERLAAAKKPKSAGTAVKGG